MAALIDGGHDERRNKGKRRARYRGPAGHRGWQPAQSRVQGHPEGIAAPARADFVDRVVAASDRTPPVMRNLRQILDNGRLGGTGYVSILPVDQGIEHSTGASFAKNPAMFDPESIVRLAIEGGCNAVASTHK